MVWHPAYPVCPGNWPLKQLLLLFLSSAFGCVFLSHYYCISWDCNTSFGILYILECNLFKPCTCCSNNNNNTNICKAHIVSIRAESVHLLYLLWACRAFCKLCEFTLCESCSVSCSSEDHPQCSLLPIDEEDNWTQVHGHDVTRSVSFFRRLPNQGIVHYIIQYVFALVVALVIINNA